MLFSKWAKDFQKHTNKLPLFDPKKSNAAGGDATYNDDGSVQIIVSHQDPGLPNWIETCKHKEGTMCWRWYRLEKTDQSYAYEYAIKLLKLLQCQRPAKRWILKSPHHLEFMNLIAGKIPEVRFFWTHRNPLESIPSFMSMMAHSRSIFSDKVSMVEFQKI